MPKQPRRKEMTLNWQRIWREFERKSFDPIDQHDVELLEQLVTAELKRQTRGEK